MTLSDLYESTEKKIVVIYPGRYQPFHRGHKAVFDYLNKNYDNVYIATSNKVALPKSPFTFDEKKKMMELTGMDTSKVIQTTNPYQAREIVEHFDKENTILFFAVSEKDMAEDPRFGFKPKKDGSPSYFQPKPKDIKNAVTMDKHGYIMTVPTFNFDVLGKPMKSASEVRSAFSSMNDSTKKKLIKDLFGNYSDEVFNIMSNNITESFSLSSEYGYNHDKRRVFGGIDQDLIKATDSLRELFHKVQNMKPGTKVRARFLIDFHSLIARIKQQMMNVELREGGWTDTVTQQTKLTPAIVQSALKVVKQFTGDFNNYLKAQGHPPVEMGSPTGSSAYHDVDDDDKEYGDIDLQMIGPDDGSKTPNQLTAFYNKLADQFIADKKPGYVYDQGKPAHGHVIFNIGGDKVQVDLMWSGKTLSDWSRWRVTPQRGIKGLITGNMYSAFGDVIGLSIQTSGVQMKTIGGEPAPFNKHKGTELMTLSTDISNFGTDILKDVFQKAGGHGELEVDQELQQYPGLNKAEVKITDLAHTIKGLAKSFELNDLYGKYILKDYSSAQDLINSFLARFEAKAVEAQNAPKFKKANSDSELAKVKNIQGQISKGLSIVKTTFKENIMKVQHLAQQKSRNLGTYKKGSEVVGLWEANGKLLLVDHKTKVIKEANMKKNAIKRMLDVKGWKLKESVDMIQLKNAAGMILNIFSDKIKGTTTVRDKNGGENQYQQSLGKVLGKLQQKGFKRHDQSQSDFGGLSLEPQDDRPHSQQNGSNGTGHFMNLQNSIDAEADNELTEHTFGPKCGDCGGTGEDRHGTCGECGGSGFENSTVHDEMCPDCNSAGSVPVGRKSHNCKTCGGDGMVKAKYDRHGDYMGLLPPEHKPDADDFTTEDGEQELMANAKYPKYGYEKRKKKMKDVRNR